MKYVKNYGSHEIAGLCAKEAGSILAAAMRYKNIEYLEINVEIGMEMAMDWAIQAAFVIELARNNECPQFTKIEMTL